MLTNYFCSVCLFAVNRSTPLSLCLLATCSGAAVLLDVRLVNKYESCHAAGSLSTPLYHPIQKWDLPSTIRRAGFAFFGIYGTGWRGRHCHCPVKHQLRLLSSQLVGVCNPRLVGGLY